MLKHSIEQIILHFFVQFSQEFRQGKKQAFELIMILAVSHIYGCYNPKQWADCLGIKPDKLYQQLNQWSLYRLKITLLKMMVSIAAENIQQVQEKSQATQSRANMTLAIDDSVIDRLGNRLRCTWRWYSGRWKKVVNGQNLLGIVLTINGKPLPIHLLFCSKQGSKNTDKPSLLISMLTQLKKEFLLHKVDITSLPITLDSWYASDELKEKLIQLGWSKIVIVGKGNYVFDDGKSKQNASTWKRTIKYKQASWGIDVEHQRKIMSNATFGQINLLFFRHSLSRGFYLMDFSIQRLRSSELWRIWKAHNLIEQFWKILKSILKIKQMRLRGKGIYTGLLIKVMAYLSIVSLQLEGRKRNLSLTRIMRQLRRESNLVDFLHEHFHLEFLGIPNLA